MHETLLNIDVSFHVGQYLGQGIMFDQDLNAKSISDSTVVPMSIFPESLQPRLENTLLQAKGKEL